MSGRHIWLIVPYLWLCISLYSSFYYFLCVFSVCSLVTFSWQKVVSYTSIDLLLAAYYKMSDSRLKLLLSTLSDELSTMRTDGRPGVFDLSRHHDREINHSWLTRWSTTSQKPTRPWEGRSLWVFPKAYDNFQSSLTPFETKEPACI